MNTNYEIKITEQEGKKEEVLELTLETIDYRGRTFNINFRAARSTFDSGRVWTSSYIEAQDLNGGRYSINKYRKVEDIFQLPSEKEVRLVINRSKDMIDRYIEDFQLTAHLIHLARKPIDSITTINAAEGTPEVGKAAVLYSRGKSRLGVITKITKTRIEIAYVTPSSISERGDWGRVTRKSAPISEVKLAI